MNDFFELFRDRRMRIMLLVLLLVVLLVLGVWLWFKLDGKLPGSTIVDPVMDGEKVTQVYTLVRWDPKMATLTLRDKQKRESQVILNLLEYMAQIPDKDGTQKPILKIVEPEWSTSFCKGDKIEVDYQGASISGVRNLG